MLLAAPADAHNPDTSYARIISSAERVELRFTFDVFTLQKIAGGLDADRDNALTPGELAEGAPAIERFLRAHIRVELDGQPVELGQTRGPEWPREAGPQLAARDWHTNDGLIAIPFTQATKSPPREIFIAFDVFESLGTRHTVLGAFEHAGKREEVTFTDAEPDYLFDTEYADGSASTPARAGSLTQALARFFRLGVDHIFLGYDHICFLIALLVVGRFRELVKIVTSFTAAHTITLILASLQIVRLPPRLVECAIAATIVYVAVENLLRTSLAHRWMLTFGFGLIHGLGFANVLIELGLPTAGRVRCLLAFNLGVEAGQLALVTAAFPLVMLIGRSGNARVIRAGVSGAVALFGIGWLVDRVFGLGLMPG
jgi:hypothetical protein